MKKSLLLLLIGLITLPAFARGLDEVAPRPVYFYRHLPVLFMCQFILKAGTACKNRYN
jgi:hypothetical protein